MDRVKEHGPLFLSTADTSPNPKSTVWSPSGEVTQPNKTDPLHRGIPLVVEDGIVLLGSPLGSRSFEKKTINDRIDKEQEIAEVLSSMMDAPSLSMCC